jgi:hypothetical protein
VTKVVVFGEVSALVTMGRAHVGTAARRCVVGTLGHGTLSSLLVLCEMFAPGRCPPMR